MNKIDPRLSHIPFGVCGIYKLTSPNNKVYIGQSLNIRKRLNGHKSDALNRPDAVIDRSIRKYGFENFKIEVLIYFKPHKDKCYNLSLLNAVETACVKKYKTQNKKFGYNIKPGGNNEGHSEETKDKISKAHMGKKLSPETIAKIKANHGRTPESYLAQSLKTKGRPQKQDRIDKVVASNLYRYKAVDQYSVDGVYIQSFRSILKAAETLNISSCRILKAAQNNKNCEGFAWRFKGESFDQPELYKTKLNQYDKDMNLIASYKNKQQAGLALGFDVSHLSKAARGKVEYAYGFIWKEFICQP